MDVEQVTRDRGECPDAEQLAAYVDGALEGQAHGAVEAHLADCDRCAATLGEAIRLRSERATGAESDEATTRSSHERRFLSRRTVVVTGSLLGMAAAFLLMTREQPHLSDQDLRILSAVEAELAVPGGGAEPAPAKRAVAAKRSLPSAPAIQALSNLKTSAARGHVNVTARIASRPSGTSVGLINELPVGRPVFTVAELASMGDPEHCLAVLKKDALVRYLSAYVESLKTGQPLVEPAPAERASTDAIADCVKDAEASRAARLRQRNELTPEDEKELTASAVTPPKP